MIKPNTRDIFVRAVSPAGRGDRCGHGVLRTKDEGHPGPELQQRRRL